jgi:regulator of sirC expression with transglutaminase-like and TPR domain
MYRLLLAILLIPAAAAAQIPPVPSNQPNYLIFRLPSEAEQALQNELATHPGMHFECRQMDRTCLGGVWVQDMPEQLPQQSDAAARDELRAMQNADRDAAKGKP